MRKLMKLIVITALTALLFCALITCAAADEKIYTSPTFTLPTDRLILAEEIFDAQEAAKRALHGHRGVIFDEILHLSRYLAGHVACMLNLDKIKSYFTFLHCCLYCLFIVFTL